MGASYYRYQQANEAAFRALLLRWLDSLHRAAWKGTFDDLGYALEAMNDTPVGAIVPVGSGLSKTLTYHESAITAAGWRLGFTRTSSARFVTLTPIRRKPDPSQPEA